MINLNLIQSCLRQSVGTANTVQRTTSSAFQPLSSLHFLVHPVYEPDLGMANAYLQKARSLSSNEVVIAFLHLTERQLLTGWKEMGSQELRDFVGTLSGILGNRLVLYYDDIDIFGDNPHETPLTADMIRSDLKKAGYVFRPTVRTTFMGETLESCVKDAAANVKAILGLIKPPEILIELTERYHLVGGEKTKWKQLIELKQGFRAAGLHLSYPEEQIRSYRP